MAMRPNLVNKQFNSPIRLYSPKNVADTLNKQTQILANGAVGIDFHNLAKPANLSNSAVLRMLEEEETRGRGQDVQEVIKKEIKELGKKPGKEFTWPPSSSTPKPVRWILAPELIVQKPGIKRVAWPPPPEDAEIVVQEQAPVYAQGPGAPQPPPVLAIRPSPSPVPPPPSTITLRQSAPTRQIPPPVFQSQPATASMKGGARSRGDQKWPPENVKQQTAAENEARMALAKGPAVRPRLVRKDYSSFFAQHALNSTYPGYKAPPGTQHYIEEGISNL